MRVNKILIIGISGTGKTRLAKKISDRLNIPTFHLDEHVWGKNWKENEEKLVEEKLNQVLDTEKWIIEGFIQPSAQSRLEKADLILYLDYSGPLAFFGGIKRWWQHRGETRPEMAEGCIEKFDWGYLKVMWKQAEKPEIEEAVKGYETKIVRLRSWKETDIFVAERLKL